MKSVKLLDCTLRDGGYINDWNFGKEAILDTIHKVVSTGVEIVEIGFLKDEPYNENRTVYNDMKQIAVQIAPKKSGVQYAAMIEVINPIPLEMLAPYSEDSVDIIRVIVWKRLLQEGFEYCKGIVKKGYKLCVQPARVDQYTEQEFVDMAKMFNQLDPMAIYVVDSWGTQYKNVLLSYLHLLDKNLKPGIAMGYHGHNNMMHAFGVAEAVLEEDFQRNLILDASIYGIGRGAGNLNTELIAKFMNETLGRDYSIAPMLDVFDAYLKDIFKDTPWGYSMAFFLTAVHGCNPNYASCYEQDLGLAAHEINIILGNLSVEDKIIYTDEKAEQYYQDYIKSH